MATQTVDFAQTGATLDTGEKDAASIRPIVNGEPAIQATFQRPMENLRHRTEVLRDAVEELKYLADADRALILQGGGEVSWGGAKSAGTGVFSITEDLILRPFMSPATSTAAKATIRDMLFATKLTGSVVPRAYSGANEINVQLTGSDGATLSAVVSGTPANNLVITLDTNASNGTTRENLFDYLAGLTPGALAFQALGLALSFASGTGTTIICNDGVFVDSDTQTLSGAVDAERHLISAAGLLALFVDVDNAMFDGDVLAIAYEDGLTNSVYGGRRQSLEDAPEDSANVDGNLFLLRNHPERLPYALPIATVVGDSLRFVDGSIVLTGIPSALTGGVPGLPPPTTEPPAQFLRMSPSGTHYWSAITSDMIVQTIGISAFSASPSVYEVGETVTNPSFNAVYTNGPAISAVLLKDVGGAEASQTLVGPFTSFTGTGSFTKPTTNGSVAFRLTATAASSPTPAVANSSILWQRMFYHGKSASSAPTLNSAFVKTTLKTSGGNALTSSKARTFAMSGLSAEFVYIAYPDSHGALTGWRDNVAGFDISFVDMGTTFESVTTESGGTNGITYRVYRTALPQTGSVNFTTR